MGLLTAPASGAIIRIGQFRTALVLVVEINAVAGLSLAYVDEYQIKDLPPGVRAHVPKFTSFLGLLVLYGISGLGVVVLLFILRSVWDFGRRRLVS